MRKREAETKKNIEKSNKKETQDMQKLAIPSNRQIWYHLSRSGWMEGGWPWTPNEPTTVWRQLVYTLPSKRLSSTERWEDVYFAAMYQSFVKKKYHVKILGNDAMPLNLKSSSLLVLSFPMSRNASNYVFLRDIHSLYQNDAIKSIHAELFNQLLLPIYKWTDNNVLQW